MFIISIGGNIGCGKTTIIDKLQKLSPDVVFKEPLEKWGSWLEMFYTHPTKCAFPFQMKVLLEFLYFNETHKNKVVITERSPLDSLHVFCKTLRDENHISEMEYTLFEEFVRTIGWKPDAYIYLRADPEVCVERIQQRARECESKIDPTYIHQIHDAHEKMIGFLQQMHHSMELHVIDANVNQDMVWDEVSKLLQYKLKYNCV